MADKSKKQQRKREKRMRFLPIIDPALAEEMRADRLNRAIGVVMGLAYKAGIRRLEIFPTENRVNIETVRLEEIFLPIVQEDERIRAKRSS